ncbi:acyl-CoA dehydrogenase [Leucobacter sp. UT-8R-CII-1-4]|uniref:acyl-CoA dehydrogenase n=1 Tax=Leucobacter sp. UT-8R-CII-1-4 TaxID=3040075 RepID=UPI0024A7AC03|nr:acyl-CoA dehydrogenase [Leucobacter sp. UT-8R-CII-1-4]MDI6022005.1 acyl-CoA dehydrogenase [Leucobacter sp. UT-8R-CII-1-4]
MAIDTLAAHASAEPGSYVPPTDEYRFLLGEAFGTDLVARASGGALTAEDAADAIDAAGEFAAEVFAPLDRVGDLQGAQLVHGEVRTPDGFKEAYRSFAEAGWVSAAVSEAAGGDGLPGSVVAALTEFWNSANAAFALCPALSLGAIRALQANASQELRDTYLPNMVSGKWTGTMNLTEPEAGSDLGAVRTMARDNGDGSWAISGQKIFITWGDHDVAENIIHLVLARTENAPAGHRGISLFVAPKYLLNEDGTPGARNPITTVGLEHKLGIHASPTCVLQFEEATGYLVGELHQGLMGMFVMMNEARVGIGVQGLGISQRAYQRAQDYAYTRLQGAVIGMPAGTPIAGHPDVRRLLLSMSSRISAMRAFSVLVGDVHDRADEGNNAALAEFFVPILKSWFTEQAVLIASDAVQVHGGMGFIEETGIAQQYRDARILPIYEGTTAIQSNDLVGRKVLRDSGATAANVFAEIRAQLETLAGSTHPVAARLVERVSRATESAERATAAILGFVDSPRDAYAVSVPYQEMLATLIGGWMHVTIANAVLGHESISDEDQRRLSEADFYGAHHLSKVHSLAETVSAGEIF